MRAALEAIGTAVRVPSAGGARKKLLLVAGLVAVVALTGFLLLHRAPRQETGPAPSTPTVVWTDWLAGQLAKGFYGHPNDIWKREAGGVTTLEDQAGEHVLPPGTRDGAIRVTYLLRGANGPNITVRDRGEGAAREHYCAEDTGETLYLFRKDGVTNLLVPLATRPIPTSIDRTRPRTLEFRFIGDTLTATLNGTVSVTAKDGTLTEGPCAVVLRQGVLMTKLEVNVP